MSKSRHSVRKPGKESDIRKIEWFCGIIAALLILLSVLFASSILRNFQVLNVVLVMGILMNLSILLLSILRKNKLGGLLTLLLILAEAAALIYFIIL
ncbi:MAG: hypothetical protein LUG99_06730 [Lachnospiraceae bacterium]|nr:hypothetical protein [Lachnospiraceae bacterium]